MSLAVRVQLKSFEAKKGDDKKKYDIKRELIRQYYSHGYDGKYIRSLFYFIDLIFRLPESFDKKLSEEIIQLEEEYKMQHVTSWERIAKKEGKREGKREGIEEGIEEGMEKKAKETAKKMLEDGLPIETILKYTGLTEKEVKELMS